MKLVFLVFPPASFSVRSAPAGVSKKKPDKQRRGRCFSPATNNIKWKAVDEKH